jgi:hypothetical protein
MWGDREISISLQQTLTHGTLYREQSTSWEQLSSNTTKAAHDRKLTATRCRAAACSAPRGRLRNYIEFAHRFYPYLTSQIFLLKKNSSLHTCTSMTTPAHTNAAKWFIWDDKFVKRRRRLISYILSDKTMLILQVLSTSKEAISDTKKSSFITAHSIRYCSRKQRNRNTKALTSLTHDGARVTCSDNETCLKC